MGVCYVDWDVEGIVLCVFWVVLSVERGLIFVGFEFGCWECVFVRFGYVGFLVVRVDGVWFIVFEGVCGRVGFDEMVVRNEKRCYRCFFWILWFRYYLWVVLCDYGFCCWGVFYFIWLVILMCVVLCNSGCDVRWFGIIWDEVVLIG